MKKQPRKKSQMAALATSKRGKKKKADMDI
jgi:hypothetical protein